MACFNNFGLILKFPEIDLSLSSLNGRPRIVVKEEVAGASGKATITIHNASLEFYTKLWEMYKDKNYKKIVEVYFKWCPTIFNFNDPQNFWFRRNIVLPPDSADQENEFLINLETQDYTEEDFNLRPISFDFENKTLSEMLLQVPKDIPIVNKLKKEVLNQKWTAGAVATLGEFFQVFSRLAGCKFLLDGRGEDAFRSSAKIVLADNSIISDSQLKWDITDTSSDLVQIGFGQTSGLFNYGSGTYMRYSFETLFNNKISYADLVKINTSEYSNSISTFFGSDLVKEEVVVDKLRAEVDTKGNAKCFFNGFKKQLVSF